MSNIQRDLPQRLVDIQAVATSEVEQVAVQVILLGKITTFDSVYLRSNISSLPVYVLSGLRNMVLGRHVICGDFKAYTPLWGSRKSTGHENASINDLQLTNLWLANDGSPTCFRPAAALLSIYLTFHSPDVSLTWKVMPELQGSDNFPIILGIDGDKSSAKREFEVVHWDYFRSLFRRKLRPIGDSRTVNLTLATSHITFRVNSPAPGLKYANLFAARRLAHR